MPRIARLKHENALYHVMTRGNNREPIFFGDDDKSRYLDTLKRYKEKYQIKIYAYCLMDNHVHLIIDSNGQDISKIMQGINLSYTQYINRIYKRCGHLFQGRFKSEIIDNDTYLLEASRYIHQNPVRAAVTSKADGYKWSSVGIYLGKKDLFQIIDEEFILKYFSNDKGKARELYLQYIEDSNEEFVAEVENDKYENRDKKVEVVGCSIDSVLNKVSACFGVCVNEITTKCNKRHGEVKHIAAYLASLKSKLTYQEIGRVFGISGSGIGQNIKKAVEIVMKDREKRRYFELVLQS